eukprot:CAMPEP_0171583178 /NCGR_PEP_ID=MMETSP0961-20121227/10662_1 /TAXON_ID=87120 /ORGANISM="Aurantiochytrium limacinum, Strain ATCCMYA-1381" /LENGTH=102 /DNA_ID=CAMNT_0012140363 /DNA_START=682 /DNA_END=992 /DNA_ORIENTATION=+
MSKAFEPEDLWLKKRPLAEKASLELEDGRMDAVSAANAWLVWLIDQSAAHPLAAEPWREQEAMLCLKEGADGRGGGGGGGGGFGGWVSRMFTRLSARPVLAD